jgi:hypothetical protein
MPLFLFLFLNLQIPLLFCLYGGCTEPIGLRKKTGSVPGFSYDPIRPASFTGSSPILVTLVSSSGTWLVDSGATCHMTGARELIESFTESDSDLYVELGMDTKHAVHV